MILIGSPRLFSVTNRIRWRFPTRPCPTTLIAFGMNRSYASSAANSSETECRSVNLQDRPLFHFLTCCQESQVLPTKGVSSNGFMKYLRKNCDEQAVPILNAVSTSPLFISREKTTSKIKLSRALEYIGDSDRFPVQIRCHFIEKNDNIEKFASSISKEGISQKELVDGISRIVPPSPSVPKEKLVHFYTNEMTHLWVYDARSARFYSVSQKLGDIARKHSHREIPQRALQALIQVHFPIAWGTLHPLHDLPYLSNYSIIPQTKSQTVSLIDWESVFDRVNACLENQFQEHISKSPDGTVLSRAIPLACFQNVLKEFIPNYPMSMPREFSIECLIQRHFSNRYSISVDEKNDLEIQPKGLKDPSWFEEKAIKAMHENTSSSKDRWLEFEEVVKTVEKSEGNSVQPTDMGAKSWVDLFHATPQLEYNVKIFVREK